MRRGSLSRSLAGSFSGRLGHGPRLLDVLRDYTGMVPRGCWSLAENPSSTYTGPLIEVVRDSDDEPLDLSYGTDGQLDVAQLADHCGASDGYWRSAYDVTGNGRALTMATKANMPKIWDGATQQPIRSASGRLVGEFANARLCRLTRADSCGLTGNPGLTLALDASTAVPEGFVRPLFSIGGTASANRIQVQALKPVGSALRTTVAVGTGSRAFTVNEVTQMHRYLVTRVASSGAGDSTMRQDGVTLQELSASSPSATPTLTDVGTCWGSNPAGTQTMDGQAGFLMLVDGAAADLAVAVIETWISSHRR